MYDKTKRNLKVQKNNTKVLAGITSKFPNGTLYAINTFSYPSCS